MSIEQQLEWLNTKIDKAEGELKKEIKGIEKKVDKLLLKDAKIVGGAIVAGFIGSLIITIVLKMLGVA